MQCSEHCYTIYTPGLYLKHAMQSLAEYQNTEARLHIYLLYP
jgi:hypothetical protein